MRKTAEIKLRLPMFILKEGLPQEFYTLTIRPAKLTHGYQHTSLCKPAYYFRADGTYFILNTRATGNKRYALVRNGQPKRYILRAGSLQGILNAIVANPAIVGL